MQVNNMGLGSVSKKKASTEPAHRSRTDRLVQRSGIFGRQMMEELQPREAHIVSADAPLIHAKIPFLGKFGLIGTVYFGAWNCHFVRGLE